MWYVSLINAHEGVIEAENSITPHYIYIYIHIIIYIYTHQYENIYSTEMTLKNDYGYCL